VYRYDSLRERFGTKVVQTIDEPIKVFDYFELSDVFISLMIILIFGVIFYEWLMMAVLLSGFLGLRPVIKRRNNRGIFRHWPYRYLRMSLPGLVNPIRRQRYSD